MKGYVLPSILVATVLLAGVFAFQPIEQASSVHTTITSNTASEIDAKDQFLSFTINDVTSAANGEDINLSEDLTDGLSVVGGYLFIDETDTGTAGVVTLYCDENADGVVDGTEAVFELSSDGFDISIDNANTGCDFLRINFAGYADSGDTVDVSAVLQIDLSIG